MEEDLPPVISSRRSADAAPLRMEDVEIASNRSSEAPEQVETRSAQHRPAAADAPVSTAQPAALSQVASLLNAFRMLLLRHFLRPGVATAPAFTDPGSEAPDREGMLSLPGIHPELLTKTPEEIAADDVLLQHLCSSVGLFTRLAAPATVSSIYLTSAFLRDETSSIASSEATVAARHLRRWAMATAVLGLAFFAFAMMLLVHVDRGRREIQQLEQVRGEYRLVIAAVDQRHDPALLSDCLKGLSEPVGQSGISSEPWCERLRDVQQRMDIAHRGLGAWNIVSYRLADVLPIRWLGERQPLPSGLSQAQWDASELRASAVMAGFTGFVLPMLLGLLGAFTYVYRDLDRRVRTATLRPADGLHGTLRILLGTILGGLLGVLWTNGQPVKLEGVTLSLTALAFFVGYSVEVVFRTLDTVIGKIASAIQK
jgi:hypothetical protein